MKKYPVSVQLYSLREAVEQIGAGKVLQKVAECGYAAVEFAGFYEKTPREIKRVLDDLGLQASSAHGPLPSADNIAQIVDSAKELGYRWHVTGFGPDSFGSGDDCRKNADGLQAGALLLKKEGLRLAYHNHWWEFDRKFNNQYPHQILMESAPDLYAQLDTYWAAVGGVNVPKIISQLNQRIPLLHIKDGPINKDQPMTSVGDGKMVWEPIIRAAHENILEWLIVELDHCATDMLAAVKKSLLYLAQQGFGSTPG